MQFPLFVGRDRSVKALAEARVREKQLLLVAQREVASEEPGPADLFPVGTLVRVQDYLALSDGSVRVMLTGTARVKVLEYLQTDPFLSVHGELLQVGQDRSQEAQQLMQTVLGRFESLTQQGAEVSAETQALARTLVTQLEPIGQQEESHADARQLARSVIRTIEMVLEQRKQDIHKPHEALDRMRKIDDAGVFADTLTPYLPLAVADQQAILETLPPRERLEKLRQLMG
jgi:ATP-dependent Lon protease